MNNKHNIPAINVFCLERMIFEMNLGFARNIQSPFTHNLCEEGFHSERK